MKYASILIIAVLVLSCSGSKKAIQNQSKDIVEAETPKVIETKDSLKTVSKSEFVIVIRDSTFNKNTKSQTDKELIVEHDTTFEAFDHSTYNSLLKKHVSDAGDVNYKGIKDERAILTNYIKSLGNNMPNDTWSKEEKLAYWINAYNALTIDLILRHYPVKSIKDIDKPWKQRYWKLGDKWYNLDEIEHQIIRKMGEPRIHFALVCAAKSCPKLYNKAFTATTLEDDLTQLTKVFLNDPTKNSISENDLHLSKIFNWFAKDFKQNSSLIDFLNQYTEITISDKAKKRFNDYNWDLNE